jgi:hypothetical protein
MAMASGDVVSIPISIVGATAVNHLSLYFQDTGTLSPFPASDVLETALYSVNGAGTKATLVSGTGSTLLISSNIAAGWVTVGIGNVSLSKNTQYLLLAQYIQDGGNGGNSQVVNIGNNGGVTTATALITASYMTNSPIEITAPGSSWTLPAAGTNGYELNVTTCP